jgi:hypothetical protein
MVSANTVLSLSKPLLMAASFQNNSKSYPFSSLLCFVKFHNQYFIFH